MQQHHGPIVGAGQELLEGFLLARLGIVLPVHIGKTPEDGLITQFLRHF